MKRHQIRWICGLTGLATLAMLALQAYIWQQGLQQQRAQFSRALDHAVFEATEEFMQPFETEFTLAEDVVNDTFALRRPGLIAIQIGRIDSGFSFRSSDSLLSEIQGEMAYLGTDVIQHALRQAPDSGQVRLHVIPDDSSGGNMFIRHRMPCEDCQSHYSQLSVENFKPYLEAELARLEIDSAFDWGVKHQDTWLIVDGDTSKISDSEWQFPFFSFPVEGFEASLEERRPSANTSTFASFKPPVISLYFPSQSWYMLRNIGSTLLASSLLALLVLACLGYAVYVILNQKQLSEIKTDFINNMTHELKTPISTIALACEAMQDSEVDIPLASRREYLKMISTENDRLAAQVEKVLQMALLDKKDLGLKKEQVSIHSMLGDVVDAFSLQLEQRKGTISTVLNANIDVVEGDALHLRQMFTNLLDNANKYSPESPEISIETKSVDAGDGQTGIEIAVHDRGLGISRDALRKIFDRFYRVPTGNRHDVKGFGLGLSYVQTMIMAHGGHVRATSKPGQGSSFYLYLPNYNG